MEIRMTNPLVPPPEHVHLRWHFIIVPYREDPEPKEWIDNAWQHNRMHATPVATARADWRYHGPCDPSATTLNPEDPVQIAEIGQQIDAFTQKMFDAVVDYASRDDLSRAVIRALKEMKR